ncbi:dedicator of cytokinesis protein 1 [Papilio machaon]|uniref:dedicator of cytokinesis protein 1 n=1 Tax=Papilio machaon TaxID=76193 RepID=UPI001E663020|nr:dedicator of cytokinesis protein 1 [Papilio machaon]
MTVWKNLENEECYAVAVYNYTSSSPHHLQLEVGELVHLHRETSHWYWGTSLRAGTSGAFPKTYVVIRDCTVDRCGDVVVASAGGRGVVHDIAVTLREWLKDWKKLYITNSEHFKFMEVSMRALLELRAQAASSALPQDQLRKVARTAIFTIDKGNRTLDMELAVRTPSGQLVDPLTISTYKLNALHDEANARLDKNMESAPGGGGVGGGPSSTGGGAARAHTLVVRVHNFVCRVPEGAELRLALHDAAGQKLTEQLVLAWPPHHLAPAQLMFTDLGSDIKKEKVFLVCHVVRIGSMEAQNIDHRRSSVAASVCTGHAMRRPFGVAAADVTRCLATDCPDKEMQVPFYPCEKENMDTLLKKVIANRELKDTKNPLGLWVSLQLIEGDLKQVREENPHLVVGHRAVARKMGFPEVILPGDARNDLYVTLCCGSYSRGGGKSSERNIELTARVVDKHGRLVPGVISIGADLPLVDEYTSLVYYHEDRPRWQEVFKVCLNIEDFKEAHIVFLCRHRSSNEAKDRAERYFALSYLRLMQREGTTTPDNQHNLCVYKIDNKRASSDVEVEAAAVCLGLPSKRDELPAGAEKGLTRAPLSLVYRDSLTVATKLCSTKLTQREEILGVLKWSAHHEAGSLRAALERLLLVPSEELVKFLQDILDALFAILTQVEDGEGDVAEYKEQSYGVLVLECLLRVISLVADHKYQHFQPVLHVYIDESFCDALAYQKLISVMVWAVRAADCGEAALKRLLLCMKCLESLMRLIVRSWQLRAALDTHQHHGDPVCYHLEELLEALVWLMRCGDHALTCQGSALKYLPHAVPHAIKIFPEVELSAYCVRALDALPLGRLSKQRLLALLELTRGELGREPAARARLLPHLAATLRALLRASAECEREAAHKSRSAGKAARLLGADATRLREHTHHAHIVELCVETMGEVVSLLARDDVGAVEADRGEFARRMLPTVLKTTATMLRDRATNKDGSVADDPLVRRMVCVLLDVVRQMSEEQYSLLVRALQHEAGGSGGAGGAGSSLVDDCLALMLQLLQRPVFRPHWADMLHLQHYVMLHALRLLSSTLRERLHSEECNTESLQSSLREWFMVCAQLATAPALQLHDLGAARRRRVAALYGDLRRDVATAIADMWYALGEHKHSFIPSLVGPFLEVSFLPDDEVRNTTIPLFYDMMITEYSHSVASGENSDNPLRALESELIDKVDVLASRGLGDGAWRARFVSACGARCREGGAGGAGAALVAAAARQLDALLQYRAAAHHRMHLTTRVLRFYEQIERPHMYIRYVHKLAQMHSSAQQWAEAGLALRLHAKLLEWSDAPLPPRLRHPTQDCAHHATHRDLKEALYLEIAQLLNRGRQWELAVEVVKELVGVYEEEALGYAPLAELHAQLAALYEAMLRTPRSHPGYFRVMYHGAGFPEHLRVPHGFVYRGNEYEQLQEFKERLLDEWPDAEVLPRLDPPGEDITNSDGQYLQINAVEPVMGDKLKRLSGRPVAEQILQYYKHNNVDKFVFSRPYHKPDDSVTGSNEDVSSQNEFATRWLERTELEISDKLPGILRWFPVVSVRTYWVSPLEAAVEALRETNRALKALVLEARTSDAPLHQLSMRLNGILDPAVQGGIVNYERAFLTPAYETRRPEHLPLLNQLRDLIADQVPLLKMGLEVHKARISPALQGLHEHMELCFQRVQTHVHQRYGRKNCELETELVERRRALRDSIQTEPGIINNRISDISTGNDTAKSKFFSAINPLTRNSSGGVVSYFGTLQNSPRRRDKRRAKKEASSETPERGGSQWYAPSAALNGNASPQATPLAPQATPTTPSLDSTSSPLRELRQELVTERPLRAEAERERRLSQRASLLASSSSAPHSNRDSLGTTDSNQEEEEPPPLPQKQSQSQRHSEIDSDQNNNPEVLPRNNYDTVWTPRGSFLYNSIAARRNDRPPTPPPKKKNAQNNA